jgi:ubiquinone/menaquinone biosynthesis C-methylase UbiE
MRLFCPSCRSGTQVDAACPECGFQLRLTGGILRALAPRRRPYFERFLRDYGKIRHAEGRGSGDPAYYRALPFKDLSGRNVEQWRMRATTYHYLESRLLPQQPLDILDIGAGNGWLSNRLAQSGHRPVAVDIFTDGLDGLAAALHYGVTFPLVEAEFDGLPFAGRQFDWAIFNSSLHYSADYRQTLLEALRCLRPEGQVVVLDSPIYRRPEHGVRMREERHSQFERTYGFRSDSIPSIEFLWEGLLPELARELRIEWRIHRPWYGLAWHLRPWKARLAQRRPPSRFWILVGKAKR